MSKVYTIKAVQIIPVELAVAWNFFSNSANLQSITPGNIGFKVTSEQQGDKVYAGQIIEYKVSPVLGLSFYWMTEITHVVPGSYFVDEQRFGPYSLWHHQHHFRVVEGGVEMTDIVHYKIPFWFLGDMANVLFVKKKVKEVFDFRYKKVEALFGVIPGTKDLNVQKMTSITS